MDADDSVWPGGKNRIGQKKAIPAEDNEIGFVRLEPLRSLGVEETAGMRIPQGGTPP